MGINPNYPRIPDHPGVFYYEKIDYSGASNELRESIFEYPELTGCSILFMDLIGHGDSSAPTNFFYSMVGQAGILQQLLEFLDIQCKIVLIAHSMGGPIAVSLAELLGNRVVGMVYTEGNIDEGDCFLSKRIIDSFSMEAWIDIGFGKYVTKLLNNADTDIFGSTFSKADPGAIYRSSQDLYAVSIEDTLVERLVKLSIPVLGVYGDRNRGKFSSEKKLTAVFPVQFIPDSGHSMMNDNPDAFYKTIIHFLEQLRT